MPIKILSWNIKGPTPKNPRKKELKEVSSRVPLDNVLLQETKFNEADNFMVNVFTGIKVQGMELEPQELCL